MYQHILLAVALQQDDGISGHALAARKVALSIARGSGAKLTVLIVYDYDSLDLSLSLPAEDLSRYRDTQRAHIDEMMEQKMKTFLSIGEAVEVSITQVLKVGEPRTLIETTRIFQKADIARDWLGDEFVDHFAATREWEWRQWLDAVTDRELKRYFEII